MDGNGRWAQNRGLERVRGHAEGVESVRAVTEACVEFGVKYLSVFAFSEENWGRPETEVDTLMKIMASSMKNEYGTFIKNGVRFRVLGNRARLSDGLNKAIDFLEDATAGGENLTLILFLSYSGKWDIQQAADRMAEEGAHDLEPYLVTAGIPDPDLIIRTSGEQRLSNYLLYQIAYAELYFTPVAWPDFTPAEMAKALEAYQSRSRRFGKTQEQVDAESAGV